MRIRRTGSTRARGKRRARCTTEHLALPRASHASVGRFGWPRPLASLLLVLGVWTAGCATTPRDGSSTSIHVRVTERGRSTVRRIPLEEYVVGVVQTEIGVARESDGTQERMLSVQALLSRTYAVTNLGRHREEGFDLCSTSHCQVYRNPGRRTLDGLEPAARAVRATAGQLIVHEHRPIQAVFHSNCGGHTSAAESVWGGRNDPYLAAKPDAFCPTINAADWQWTVEADTLRDALNRSPRTRVGRRLGQLDVLERDAAGRATRLGLGSDSVVHGTAFRDALLAAFGARSLRSTRFTVRHDGQTVTFVGRGNGHGVGLCQVGALARARAGHPPGEIISAYYPGTRVQAGRAAPALPSARPRVTIFPSPTGSQSAP